VNLAPGEVGWIMRKSPIGPVALSAASTGLTRVQLLVGDLGRAGSPLASEDVPVIREAERQLEEYFAGQRTDFELPLAPAGSEFQRQVWQAVSAVPYGTTASYGDIARIIGRPRAARAVGRANATNPLALIVPCHRIVSSSGELTGYGGGLDTKRWLLAQETRGVSSAHRARGRRCEMGTPRART